MLYTQLRLAILLLAPAAIPALFAPARAEAQDQVAPLGFVNVESATVSGALEITGGRAAVRGGGVIVARDHTAELLLNRGGSVDVCSTSSLHVTAGTSVMGVPPLLLALDRGALEIRMRATSQDVIITPDLRISMTAPGPLNLHMRVTPNGDTCVENKGLQAPVLQIVNQLGDERYELRAGQHVLFEHGSLREVVDHESSACGCPPPLPAASLADNGVSSTQPASPGAAVAPTAAQPDVAAQHPFPAALSAGLAPETPTGNAAPQQSPGTPHAQVAATMAYGDAGASDGTGPLPATTGTPAANPSPAKAQPAPSAPQASLPQPAPTAPERAQAPPPPAPPGAGTLGHRIARFFQRIFGGG